MTDPTREAAMRAALAGVPPLPTDGQVIREAMSRIVPIVVSEMFGRWRKCPWRRCRREQCCVAPQMECMAAPRTPPANIETTHAWLATRLREQLMDILLERMLGTEVDAGAAAGETSHA
jgi:hypothetical protein